jgi:outer membrane protein OmpA-like peptidoglycan-associated protein
MKKALLIVAVLGSMFPLYSQKHATCNDAIPITSSSYGPVTPQDWADASLCMPNNENMYFGKTHKVVWFSFIIPYDTILTFQVVPENASDDFDFILFKADRGDFCQKEKQQKVKPIRTNFAKPTAFSKGICGLSAKGTQDFVPPGFNNPSSSVVQVKKGEWYYIVVDSYANDKGGFTLKIPLQFNANPSPGGFINNHVENTQNTKPDTTHTTTIKVTTDKSYMDAMPIKAPPIQFASAPNFFIHVLDSAGHPIKASLIIDGAGNDQSIKIDTSLYSLQLNKYQAIKIRANAAGHMPYQSSYTESGDTSSVTFWIRLQPIKVSEKITLKDIEFGGDSPNILPNSKPALDYILQFLLNNPNVKIVIKGYTNDPNHTAAEKYDQVLSEKRANSIKSYLSSHGVDKKRMECIGYGSTKLVYPHPISEDQKIANRRVEIEIQ